METMLKVEFFIIDREFDDEYNYTGHFKNNAEFGLFLVENAEVGNEVTVLSVKEVPYDEEILNKL